MSVPPASKRALISMHLKWDAIIVAIIVLEGDNVTGSWSSCHELGHQILVHTSKHCTLDWGELNERFQQEQAHTITSNTVDVVHHVSIDDSMAVTSKGFQPSPRTS